MKVNVFWFRRDLRLHDNCGLYHALKSKFPVVPVFIFDTNILDKLENKNDARVEFIHNRLCEINIHLRKIGSSLKVYYGKAEDIWREILKDFEINEVYTNRDYEPYARERDNNVRKLLSSYGVGFHDFKDQVVFETGEVVKSDGKPYTVFTPYSKAWLKMLEKFPTVRYDSEKLIENFCKAEFSFPSLDEIGFGKSAIEFPPAEIREDTIINYHKTRDYPFYDKGTSRLGVHLRFGTVSVRELVKLALKLNRVWLNELIWREFFMMILWNFPESVVNSFRKEYDLIEWRNNEKEFELWCKGETGYPIVDAGMRELNTTGYMHNRVRMIVASFLTKDLLIDWRWGERYFAEKLLDFELSSNVGNWQWAAGTGCDAAPYFRIFNPDSQTKKFDPELKYIRKWVPEFNTLDYTPKIVEHSLARIRAVETYRKALKRYRK
ncbi:MAG: DNA photolyase family protein [Ignavibacteria bacterium]|nr:DNA photolyase family protein [Ignavibacteria bacterium]